MSPSTSGRFISLCPLRWRRQRKNPAAQKIIDSIVEAHSTLVALRSLRPGEVTNRTLGSLVALCCESHDADTINTVLSDARIRKILPSLRRISAESECCLETYWTDKIAKAVEPEEALDALFSFPYYQNYVELSRLELHALYAVEPRVPRKIAFLGSGPLPLTSMCLLKALRETASRMQPASKSFDTTIVNIDRDAAAHTSAITLHESLGSWSQGMEFMCADASLVAGLEEYDVVFLAALVGVTQEEKESLTFSIARRMRPGALLVVRSAYGLRAVLYPEVDLNTESLRSVLQVETVTHPFGKVVNSVIVAKIKDPVDDKVEESS